MDGIVFLGATCVGLCLWIIHLQRKLSLANEFAHMTMMALRDVADGKVQITREGGEGGTITIKVRKPNL